MLSVKFDHENNLWSSCGASTINDPSASIGHILLESLQSNGSRIAQISDDTGEQFTFDEFRRMTIRSAQNLQVRGYKTQQVFGVISGNVVHLAPIVFASLCMGCPISTLDASAEKRNIIHMIKNIEPQIIFCDVAVYDLIVECLNEVKNDLKIFTFNGTKNGSESVENLTTETGIEEDFKPVDVDGINDIAFILNTSGSTGPSKSVCLSHANISTDACDATLVKLYQHKTLFCPSSLFWISGVINLLLGAVAGSTRIITTKPFSTEKALRIIEQYKVSVIDCSSNYLVMILKSGLLPTVDLSSIHHIFIGGFKIPFYIKEKFNSLLPNGNVHNAYGLTEVGYNVSVDLPHFSGKNTVGRLVNGVTIKIIDEKGNRCGVGVNGEVCIKGRFKFLGYYKDEKLIDEAVDSDGFFKTGDIGHMDEDGYLFLADRKKDLIVHHDNWVFPSEIEEILMKSSKIKSVCVAGVQYDEIFEFPAALVIRSNGSSITEEEISKIVEDNLADCCKLRGGVYFVDSIPLSVTGKLLRREVKNIVTELYKIRINCKNK